MNMQLKVVLVDDELACTNSLKLELEAYCPEVNVIQTFNSTDDAIIFLNKEPIDVLFLDIEMGNMTGFDLLNKLKNTTFDIVFVTAHDSYAVRAFEYCAIDYLLKPILKYRLIESIEKIKKKQKTIESASQNFSLLNSSFQSLQQQLPVIPIPTLEGLLMIRVDEIIFIEAEGNYSNINMKNPQEKYFVSKSLKEIEALLSGRGFIRTHNSYIVNPIYIKKYIKGAGGYLVLMNGQTVDVSRANKERVIDALGG